MRASKKARGLLLTLAALCGMGTVAAQTHSYRQVVIPQALSLY